VNDLDHPPAIPPTAYMTRAMVRTAFFDMTLTSCPAINPKKIARKDGSVMVWRMSVGFTSGKEALIWLRSGATVSVAMMVRNDNEKIAARFNFIAVNNF